MALSRHDDDDNGGDSSSMMMIVIVSPDHHPAPDQKESKENDKVRSEKVDDPMCGEEGAFCSWHPSSFFVSIFFKRGHHWPTWTDNFVSDVSFGVGTKGATPTPTLRLDHDTSVAVARGFVELPFRRRAVHSNRTLLAGEIS
jgi:hypothetical protein